VRAQPTPADLGNGLWSVPVPIPGNPLGYTLVYALDSPAGPVLVDAGWQHAASWEALSGGLATLGLDVAGVYGVIVTHHHPDHSGLAGRVREASGAWIAMHPADIALIRRFHKIHGESLREWEAASLRRAGASEAEVGQAQSWDRQHIDPPAIPDRELADGDLADLPGRDLRVIHTPGHSPGHVCLYLEDSGRLFTGDHVLPKITPNIGLYALDDQDANPLADFLQSLTRTAKVGAREALPAHEFGFTDVDARIAAIEAHHEERLGEVMTILADAAGRRAAAPGGGAAGGFVTLWEVTSRLRWNVAWADMNPMLRRMASGEAAAHLRLLESRGIARQVPGGEPLRYMIVDGHAQPAGKGTA
jgi:glyoxylase-like metal-dependent hydrolase (beta-lactamase superfamily II)